MTHKPSNLYRRNVGIAVFDREGRVLLAERTDRRGWQMPQGGIDEGEQPWPAALRELEEEIGTAHVDYLGEVDVWLRYEFPVPDGTPRSDTMKRYAGQEQKWFAVRFLGEEDEIDLTAGPEIEFSRWRWGTLAEAVALIVAFKRPVYEEMARHFARFEVRHVE